MDYKLFILCILLAITELHGKEQKSKHTSKVSTELIDQEATASEKNVVRQRRENLDTGHPYIIKVVRKPKKSKTKKIHLVNMRPDQDQRKFEESKVHHTSSEIHEHVEEPHPIEYDHKDATLNSEFPQKKGEFSAADSHPEGSENLHVEQIHQEPMKVKHHHHHHHHVKTIIKKVPYPVEKVIHVPKPYPVEKIVEKVVHVPVEKVVHVPKPYPVEKVVEKTVHVPVEKIVHVPKPYPVEKIVHVPYERIVKVPVEKIVTRTVPVEKIVEKIVHVPKPYPVLKPVPFPVEVKVPVHIPHPYPVEKKVPVPYPVEKKVPYPVRVEVEKKVPVKVYVSHPPPPKYEDHHSSDGNSHRDENHSYGSYEHDFSSQDSRVHSVKIPKEPRTRMPNQQSPVQLNIEPKPLLSRAPEYQIQRHQAPIALELKSHLEDRRPQHQAPIALEVKSHLEDRRPQTFPALTQESQPVQQIAPPPPARSQPNFHEEHFDHMQHYDPNYHYTSNHYHPGVRQHVIQGSGSEIQPSIALPEHTLPTDHSQQGGNLMVHAPEALPRPMPLVQHIAPLALPQISIQLVPMQQTNEVQSDVNIYRDPNQY